jgi:hypothetical protein
MWKLSCCDSEDRGTVASPDTHNLNTKFDPRSKVNFSDRKLNFSDRKLNSNLRLSCKERLRRTMHLPIDTLSRNRLRLTFLRNGNHLVVVQTVVASKSRIRQLELNNKADWWLQPIATHTLDERCSDNTLFREQSSRDNLSEQSKFRHRW